MAPLIVLFETRYLYNLPVYFLRLFKASSALRSLIPGALANFSASCKASVVFLLGSSILTSKGKPPTAMDLWRKTLIAVVRSIPSSSYNASERFFKSSSNSTVRSAVAIISSFSCRYYCLVLFIIIDVSLAVIFCKGMIVELFN